MISKSDYMTYLQSQAILWHQKNRPDLLPQDDDPSAEARMTEGKAVEALARRLFPEGRVIDHDKPFEGVLADSVRAIETAKPGQPVFQAVVQAGDLLCECDVLIRRETDLTDLYEIKASNEVKEEHLPDVAFQRRVLDNAGILGGRTHLVHLNRDYVRRGEVVPSELFAVEDVTEATGCLEVELDEHLDEMRRMLASPEPPVRLGEDAIDPRDHPMLFPDVAAIEHSVFDLYRGRKKAVELYEASVVSTADIPPDVALTDRQQIQVQCERSGIPCVDRDEIDRFLGSLERPLYLLDFETMAPAIPLVDGTRPYRQTPFQFSLHVCRSLDEEPEHHGWIWDPDSEGDPRLELLNRLRDLLGGAGSIIVYNASFERMILRQAAAAYPEYAGWADSILDRIVDLLIPFRSFAAYHPDQHGSCSIKRVLPAWCPGCGYEGMAIADGEAAAREFVRVTFGGGGADREAVVRSLNAYCRQDTMAMLDLLRALSRVSA